MHLITDTKVHWYQITQQFTEFHHGALIFYSTLKQDKASSALQFCWLLAAQKAVTEGTIHCLHGK